MKRSRLVLAFLTGLIAGLGGETLLFLESQCAKVETVLKGDFRVALFLESDADEGRRKVLEEKLRALPDVESVRYVSRGDALAALRREDPELAESVTLIGDNPLSPAFEVRLADAGMERVAAWVAEAQSAGDWSDIRYKAAQVQAVLQAQFYRHVIDLVTSAVFCLTALLALVSLWHSGRSGKVPHHSLASWHFKLPDYLPALGLAAVGAAVGAGLTALAALPLKMFTPWWAWPSLSSQALLIVGSGIAGWVLCGRGD